MPPLQAQWDHTIRFLSNLEKFPNVPEGNLCSWNFSNIHFMLLYAARKTLFKPTCDLQIWVLKLVVKAYCTSFRHQRVNKRYSPICYCYERHIKWSCSKQLFISCIAENRSETYVYIHIHIYIYIMFRKVISAQWTLTDPKDTRL